MIACLFLLVQPLQLVAQQWAFDSVTHSAYRKVLNLELDEAYAMIPEAKTAQQHYVLGLGEALELLLTEDASKFDEYEARLERRIHEKIKGSANDYRFLRAELHLQWAFVYLKFGQEIDAARHFRDAYHIAVACRKKSPDYLAIQKTTGLLEIIIGSVPEKYNWIMSLLSMKGTIELGLQELNRVRDSKSPLAFEAGVLLCLAKGYVFQKPDIGLAEAKAMIEENENNRLLLFLASSLAVKNFQSEVALGYLNRLQSARAATPLYYADYLKGDVLLHKGDYQSAIASYRWFLTHFKGTNNMKDAAFKMGLCYHLNGNRNDALHYFDEAKSTGKENVEADKSAARTLSEGTLPNIPLSKVRYATDGGYYDEARTVLNAIKDADLPASKDKVEFYYRKARLEHRLNQPAAARLFYTQVIDMSRDDKWYFAPNACLQMGYIALDQGQKAEAKRFFQKALSYKKHEYKNSIDSKARSALSQLE